MPVPPINSDARATHKFKGHQVLDPQAEDPVDAPDEDRHGQCRRQDPQDADPAGLVESFTLRIAQMPIRVMPTR